jgi:hypothetical protein
MQSKSLIAVLSTAIALGAAGTAARAQTSDDMSFAGMLKMERIDTNKDKMVSRAEFVEMMGKIYDMKTKEMKVKGDKVTAAELQQIMMYLKAGS